MCNKILQQSYVSGIAFKIEVIERGKVTDKVVLRTAAELLTYTQKYCGASDPC
jgi:hypothetical protein